MSPSGVYEHISGVEDLDQGIRYWRQFGYAEAARGTLSASQARSLYGVDSALESVRLRHQATSGYDGLVRLMCWDGPLDHGLEFASPLTVGSRWTACFTRDLLRVRDAYSDQAASSGDRWDLTPIVRLASQLSGVADPSFYAPFVGEYESFVIGRYHRHAFLQFAVIAAATDDLFTTSAYPVSVPRHADLVTASPDTAAFYRDALGLEARPPSGGDSTNPQYVEALSLRGGEAWVTNSFKAPGQAGGILRIYGMTTPTEDARARSRPGHLGLCCFSIRYPAGGLAVLRLDANGATTISDTQSNEFGEPSVSFDAPDGIAWVLVEGA